MTTTQLVKLISFTIILLIGAPIMAQDDQPMTNTGIDNNRASEEQPQATFTIFEGLVEPVIYNGLSNFDCKKSNGEVQLRWVTLAASLHQGFDIERSSDYLSWEKLGYQDARNEQPTTGEYSFNDLHPRQGVNYYRIRQIDSEGEVNYSQTLKVEMGEGDFPAFFKVYPNPTNGNLVNIKLPAVVVNGTNLEIYDPTGRKLIQQTVAAPMAELDISSLNRGVYLMKIQIGQTIWSRKLIVQ